MRKSTIVWVVFLALSVGCFPQFGDDELYRLPQPPIEIQGLQSLVEEEIAAFDAQYAPPVSGTNRQSIQMIDLDGGGGQEAIVFLRLPGEIAPSVYIYTIKDGRYVLAEVIEGMGEQVDRVEYADLYGDGRLELLLSWRMTGGTLRALSVYLWAENVLTEVLARSFNSYLLLRIREDGPDNLIFISLAAGSAPGAVEWYQPGKDGLTVASSAPISDGIVALRRIRVGSLTDGVTAVAVTGQLSPASAGDDRVITDIFSFQGNRLKNIVYDPESRKSALTERTDITGMADINGDGVIDLPRPVWLPALDPVEPGLSDVRIDWYSYSSSGAEQFCCSTILNAAAGWYFVLPDAWTRDLILSRDDGRSALGERALHLYHADAGSGRHTHLATFYSLTGPARSRFAGVGATVMLEVGDVTVTVTLADLPPDLAPMTVALEDLAGTVRTIEPQWLTFEAN